MKETAKKFLKYTGTVMLFGATAMGAFILFSQCSSRQAYQTCMSKGTGTHTAFAIVGQASTNSNSNENTNTNNNVNGVKKPPVLPGNDNCYEVFKKESRQKNFERFCDGELNEKCRKILRYIDNGLQSKKDKKPD